MSSKSNHPPSRLQRRRLRRVSTSHPSAVTSTSSSIRTPPTPVDVGARLDREDHARLEHHVRHARRAAGRSAAPRALRAPGRARCRGRRRPPSPYRPSAVASCARRSRSAVTPGRTAAMAACCASGHRGEQPAKLRRRHRQAEPSASDPRSIRRRPRRSPAPPRRPSRRPRRPAARAAGRCWARTRRSSRSRPLEPGLAEQRVDVARRPRAPIARPARARSRLGRRTARAGGPLREASRPRASSFTDARALDQPLGRHEHRDRRRDVRSGVGADAASAADSRLKRLTGIEAASIPMRRAPGLAQDLGERFVVAAATRTTTSSCAATSGESTRAALRAAV